MTFLTGVVIAILTGTCIRLWLENRKNVRALDGVIDEMKTRYASTPDYGTSKT